MGLRFNCPTCGTQVLLKYLAVGDIAKCRTCGCAVSVPESAEQVNIEDDEYREYMGLCDSGAAAHREDREYLGYRDTAYLPERPIAKARESSGHETEEVGISVRKIPRCYICGRPLEGRRGRLSHYCKQCKRQFPEFMRDGVKHVFTMGIALTAFRPGSPVTSPDMYCDRNIGIPDLLACLSEFKLIGILGERGVGKSSTLQMLLALLRGNPVLTEKYGPFRWAQRTVYTNEARTFRELLHEVTHGLIMVRPRFRRFSTPDAIELTAELGGIIKGKINLSTDAKWNYIRTGVIRHLQSDPLASFLIALKLLRLADLRGVILVDELEHFSSEDLRALGDLIKRCEAFETAFCFAGIVDTLDEICCGHGSVARTCRVFRLERFGLNETRALFERANDKLESYVQFSEDLIDEIAVFSNGIPSVVHGIGYQILLKTIGDSWQKFAEAARTTGPIKIDRTAIDLAARTVSEWLPVHSDWLDRLSKIDPRLVEILRRIAKTARYPVADEELPTLLEDIPEGLSLFKRLETWSEFPLLKSGTLVAPYQTASRHFGFVDPVLGWLVSLTAKCKADDSSTAWRDS